VQKNTVQPSVAESGCQLCPRRCRAARTEQQPGWCGAAEPAGFFRVAKLMAQFWEEPFISGSRGSGTVFFSGCHLGCCFCQNEAISHRRQGTVMAQAELVAAMTELARQGVHNFNLVSASHYADQIPSLVSALRQQGLNLPIVWNSSGYETVASLRALAGSIDIYLPDCKFADGGLAMRLAGVADYLPVTLAAIREMHRQQPVAVYDQAGVMLRGLVIRHLILPGHYRDSCKVLEALARTVPLDTPLSLMRQYTPMPQLQAKLAATPELGRRLTTFEYAKVVDYALKLGFTKLLGQERTAATTAYTPDFTRLRD
jgi:putative pyruvate formate lyase activating enzyme